MAENIPRLPISIGEVLNALTNYAKSYHKDKDYGAVSVMRNRHMNALTGKEILTDEIVDAVVVDYINYIAAMCGVDLALYTQDLKDPPRLKW